MFYLGMAEWTQSALDPMTDRKCQGPQCRRTGQTHLKPGTVPIWRLYKLQMCIDEEGCNKSILL